MSTPASLKADTDFGYNFKSIPFPFFFFLKKGKKKTYIIWNPLKTKERKKKKNRSPTKKKYFLLIKALHIFLRQLYATPIL